MAFINWGEETPEQLRARKKMEDQMMFEQASYNAAMAAAAAAGSGRMAGAAGTIVRTISWANVAPDGSGSIDHDWTNFDNWETAPFVKIPEVTGLEITCDSAHAHVHNQLPYSDLKIELYEKATDTWLEVWTYRLQNPNHPQDDSADWSMSHVKVNFPPIIDLTAIRVSSNPGSDQTYHDWDDPSLRFNFYLR